MIAVLLVLPFAVFATAEKEVTADKVVVYASVDEANAKLILDAFTAESNNPQADVWMGAPSENHVLTKSEGLTVPYLSPSLSELGDVFKDSEGYWRSFYMNPMAFAVNTEALAKISAPMPTSWDDLLKPVYNGHIQMLTPQASETAYNIVSSLVVTRGEDEASKYMAKLNPNVQTYTSLPVQALPGVWQ